ncbi:MAG: DUF167 domain-containing protein [Alphaproteobacteria bacterium]
MDARRHDVTAARPTADGILLHLRVSPGAGHTKPAGFATDDAGIARLKLRISAPPVDGAANAAVIAYLAKTLGLAKRDCTLTQGLKSRSKTVTIKGAPDALLAHISQVFGDPA